MIEKYLENSNFKEWMQYWAFMSKLTSEIYPYNILMEDNRIFKCIFYDGEMYPYRYFIAYIETKYGNYRFPSASKDIGQNDVLDESLERMGIIVRRVTPHPYYKNAKSLSYWARGPNYKMLKVSISDKKTDEIILLSNILDGSIFTN